MPLNPSDKKIAFALLALIVPVLLCARLCDPDQPARTARPAPRAQEPAKTDEQVLAGLPASDGKYAAAEIVRNRALAPSQVKIVEKQLVASKANYALAYVVIDSPNPFGVMLRKGYCVVLRFVPPRGTNYAWDKAKGIVECQGPPDAATAWTMKAMNEWPDLDKEPMPDELRSAGKGRR